MRSTALRGSGAALAASLLLSCGTAPVPVPGPFHSPPVRESTAAQAVAPSGETLSLVARGRGLPVRSQWRQGFDVADLDGDGPLDVVFGPPRKGAKRPGLFLGDGLGAFRFWSEATVPKVGYDYGAAAAGDWNGDGKIDLAFAVHLRGLTALLNEGGGHFAPFADGLVLLPEGVPHSEPIFTSRCLRAADWNGDGRPDLIALGEGPAGMEGVSASALERRGLRVFINWIGFWEPVNPEAPEEEFGDGLALGDVDADGHLDAVVTSSQMGSRRILRRGKGKGWTAEEILAVPSNALVTAVAIGGFDRESGADIVIAWMAVENGAWTTGIDLLYSRPRKPGGFEKRAVWRQPGRLRITSLDAGDLDGDLATDLVALDEEGTLQVFRGDGHGFLSRDVRHPAPPARTGCSGSQVLLRDVDGDGKDDIVAAFAGEATTASALSGRPCASGGAIEVWSAVLR